MIMGCLFTGCKENRVKEEQFEKVETGKTQESAVSDNKAIHEGIIGIVKAGYEDKGSKRAIVECSGEESSFYIIDEDSGQEVYSGRIKYRDTSGREGKKHGICDFSSFEDEGSYRIETDSGIVSETFKIKEGVYKELLNERLSRLKDTVGETERLNAGNLKDCYIRIVDCILMQEFFMDAEPEDEENIPDVLAIAGTDTRLLQNYINKYGVLIPSLNADAGTTYQYSAVMSMFAYEYRKYDKAYSDDCLKLSELAYSHAEEMYGEASAQDRAATEDKRFWAAAQLYKAGGRSEYRKTAEEYADSVPKGFTRDESGYLGSVAYLTCYNKIDLKTGEKFITALMNDINTSVKDASADDWLAVSGSKDDDIDKVFETARLMVLGNYITKNIKYVETAENQLAYLYGRNESCEDHALYEDAGFYNEPQLFILAGLVDSYIYGDNEPKEE